MKTLRPLFGLFVVVAVFYTAWKIVPPFFNEWQFEDAIEEVSRYAAYNQQKTEQDIREDVAKKAHEFDIPLIADQIKVLRQGAEITISADYTVLVDLPIHPFTLTFHPATKNKRI